MPCEGVLAESGGDHSYSTLRGYILISADQLSHGQLGGWGRPVSWLRLGWGLESGLLQGFPAHTACVTK